GKTTVGDAFEQLGIDVIDADVIAHQITAPGEPALEKIVELFGPSAVDANGRLDRAFVRGRVFDKPELREKLEALLHPVIRERMDQAARRSTSAYCILSIPLLVESGNTARVDRVLVVDAPDERRRVWIQNRSGLSDKEIDKIFAAQSTRESRLAIADDVIVNDGSVADLTKKVETLHRKYVAMAAGASSA
ncbi:MAG: dephospho-CoA kinase, partial [Proteobacteria bacterium]